MSQFRLSRFAVINCVLVLMWAYVCQSALPVIAQETNPIASGEPVVPPVVGATPQYPVRELGFDGTNWVYATNCCKTDNHPGIFFSSTQVTQLGCGMNGSGGTEYSIVLDPPPAGFEPGTSIKLVLGSKGFDTLAIPPAASPTWYNKAFQNYYAGTGLSAAIELKDKHSAPRWFSLVKLRIRVVSEENPPVNIASGFDYFVPALIASRSTVGLEFVDNNDVRGIIPPSPTLTTVTGNLPGIDWGAGSVSVVEIEWNDPANADLKVKKQCLLIHR